MTKKIFKIVFGIALAPFCIGFTWQFGSTLLTVQYKLGTPYYFSAGCLAYLAVHILFKKPILTYVVGHELTHAFFAVLFGGSVKSIHASNRGGRVTITKSNFVITLAPYFFPLYTFLALILYWLARSANLQDAVITVLVFLSGSTFAFHLVLTFIFLQTDQTDIHEYGVFFSYPLIYLFNIFFSALLIYVYLAENMDYLVFLTGGIIKSLWMLYWVFNAVVTLIRTI